MPLIKPKYIYLLSSLPSISWAERKVHLDIQGLCEEIREHLAPQDKVWWEFLFFPYDLDNLLHIRYATSGSWKPLANFDRETLETFASEPENIVPHFQVFWDLWKETDKTLAKAQLEQKLYELYYRQAQKLPQGFLRTWFLFYATYKTQLSDWAREDMEKPAATVLTEDLNPFREEGAYFYHSLVEDHPDLRKIWENPDIRQREEAMDHLLFERLEELRFSRHFGIESLLIYGIQLQLRHRWEEMEASDGVAQFEQAIRHMENQWMQNA